MKSILILCLLGGVFADYDWKPKQEYQFQLEGRSLAGMASLSQQFTGVHYRGNLKVQSQGSNVLAMKLENMTYTKVNTELEGGWWDTIPEDQAEFQKFPMTDSTFIAKLEKGVVKSLVVSHKLPDWQINFLQGLAAQLQLDISGSNAIHRMTEKSNSISGRGSRSNVFSVMENSVTGRCEVLYEVSPLPKFQLDELPTGHCGSRPLLEITKTRNHSNCETNPEYHFGFPQSLRCQPNGNQCGQFWTRSTLSRIIGCGGRGDLLLLAAVTSSRVFANLHLHNGTVAEANSYVNVTLKSVRPISKMFHPPTDPLTISQLQYKYSSKTPESGDCKHKGKSENNSSEGYSGKKKPQSFDSTKSSEEEKSRRRHKRKSMKNKKPSSSGNNQSKGSSSSVESKHVDISNSEETGQWIREQQDGPPMLPFDALSLALMRTGGKTCLSQQLREILSDIASDLDSYELNTDMATLKKIVMATRVCRMMTLKDLQISVGSLIDARENKILMSERKVFRDIMAICGTDPAFEIVAKWIEERKVKGDEAAALVAYVPSYLISPSKKTIDRFYDLIRSSALKSDKELHATAVLAFSNALRVTCVDQIERKMRFPYNVLGKPCMPDSASRYIEYLASQLQANPLRRTAFLTALGNTGSLLALPALKAAARNSSNTPYLRARAIIAMKHLVLNEPETMAPILLSFFDDKQAPELVRLTAVSMLFFSKLPIYTWQRIAVGTWFEQSPSIRTFIWSSLKSFAGSNDGISKDMSTAAASALPLAKFSSFPTRHQAHNILISKVFDDLQEVITKQIILFDGISGTNFYMRQINRISGISRVSYEADLWIANPNAFRRDLMKLFYPDDDRNKNRPPISGLSRTTKWIKEYLKIVPRTGPKMEGDLNIRLHRLVESIKTLNESTIADLSEAAKKLKEKLKSGPTFHKQGIDYSYFEMSTTTDMGFPVSFGIYNPRLLRAAGSANLSNESTKQIEAELAFKYGEDLHSELSIYTPFDGVQHVAAHHSQRLFTPPPIRLSAKWNETGDAIKVFMSPQRSMDNTTAIYSDSELPFTLQRNVSQMTTKGFDKNAKIIHSQDSTSGEMSSIEPFRLKYTRELSTSRPGTSMNMDYFRPLMILDYSFILPSLHVSKIQLLMDNFPQVSIELGMGKASVKHNGIKLLETFPAQKAHTDTASSEEPTVSTTATPMTTVETDAPSSTPATTEAVAYTQVGGQTTPANEEAEEGEGAPSRENVDTASQMTKGDVFNVYQINTDSPVGDFNASSMDVFGFSDSGSRIEYILKKMLSGINSGTAYVFGFVASTEEEQPASSISAYVGVSSEITSRLGRAAIFMSNLNQSIGMTQVLHIPAFPIASIEEALRANLSSQFYMNFAKSESESWSIKGSMMRSKRKAAVLRTKRFADDCLGKSLNFQPECRNIFREASTLDRYNFTLLSKDGARTLQNSQYLSSVKYWFYPHMTEERFDEMNAADEANIMVDICQTNDCVGAFLKFPDENIHFDRVPTNSLITSSFLMNPVEGFFASLKDSSFCSLEQEKMVTFDGLIYEPRMNSCWYLMAKDCSGVSRIAISTRKRQNETELEVNLDNYRVLRLSAGPRAQVNGLLVEISANQIAEVTDLAGTTLMVITKGMDQAIQVKMPTHGFDIIYTNTGVLIKADTSLKGALCGLCGDYDGQLVDEMKKPDAKVASSAKDFTTSYELKGEGSCDSDKNE